MKRREFIVGLGAAATWPFAARAQQPAKMKRIAFVHPDINVSNLSITSEHRGYRTLFEELRRLGYIEGQNLIVDRYSAEGRTEQYASLADDVVRTNPDLILAITIGLVSKLKAATATIPLVAITGDPVVAGLVPSLARPGGNITGIASLAGLEVWGKRLELLLEATPKSSNIRFLTSRYLWESPQGEAIREIARRSGIPLVGALVDGIIDEAQYRRVFAAMEQDRVDGLMLFDAADTFTHRRLLVELAARSRIPAIYTYREFVELGGLMAYSFDLADIYRRVAEQIDKILKGANPGEIPIYQTTRFELAINLKTAKALGLDVPPTLLARADEVIE